MKKKPYFTKWIPIEGRIKKGMKYILTKSLGLGAYKKGYVGTAAIDFTEEAQKSQGAKILKFFLCSRDIKVGDKGIWGYDDDEKIWFEHPKQTFCTSTFEGKVSLNCNNSISRALEPGTEVIKVVGEVSQDALNYVKKGMEFREDEVEEWQYTDKGWYLPVELSSIKGLPTKFKVKCSNCGRFH